MSDQKKYTVTAQEVALLMTSYVGSAHGIALEVDLERMESLISTIANGSLEVTPEVKTFVVKILEVDVENKRVKFVLPAGFPVYKHENRNSYYANLAWGRPVVAQTYLNKSKTALEKDLERKLAVSEKVAGTLEVGSREVQFSPMPTSGEKPDTNEQKSTSKTTSGKKDEKAERRLAEHKARTCTCTPNWTCHAVKYYGASKLTFDD